MIHLLKTANASPELLQTVYDLVINGRQVILDEQILKKNIANSHSIAWKKDVNGKVLAIAVLKNPQKSYKRKVFEKAGVASAKDDYIYELGYCVTLPPYQGRGYCSELVTSLTYSFRENTNLFATTKNPGMKALFEKLNWVAFGEPYSHEENEPKTIELYVYEPNNLNII